MKQIKQLFLIAAVAAAVALPFVAQAYQPQEVVIPLAPFNIAFTNQTVVTNTAASVTPFQGLDQVLVLNATVNQTSNFVAGLDCAYDPNGTNFTTTQPVTATFVPSANLGSNQVMRAYLLATNFTGVTKIRLGSLANTGTNNTPQRLALEANY